MNGRTATLCNKFAARLLADWRRDSSRRAPNARYRGPSPKDVRAAFGRQPAGRRAQIRRQMERTIAAPVPRETTKLAGSLRPLIRP